MPATAIGINAAASAVFLKLQKMFPDFSLVHEEMPDFSKERRFVMICKELVDAEALAKLAEVNLGANTSWIDIGNFLADHVRACLIDQSRGFTHPPLLQYLEVEDGEDPADVYWQ